jgi:hypothetical protein
LASARALAVLDGDLMDLSDQVEAAEATARSGHEALDAAGVSRVGHTNLWAAQSVWASDPRLALEYGEAALDNARATGNPTALAVGWWAIGMACSLTDPARALAALETCFALIRDGAGDGVYPAGLVVAAGIAARLGETDRVPGYLREALLWARDTGNHPAGTTAVFVATGVFLDQGHLVVASTLAGAIEGPLALIAPVAPVLETLLVLERLESLSPLLVADDLAAAHQRGMSMSYDEVIEYLLDQVDSVPTV